MFVITQTMRTATKHPSVQLYYQGVLLLSVESRGARPWEALQGSPTLRQQFIQQLETLGLNEVEIRTVLSLPFNGLKPCYVAERVHVHGA